MRIHTVSPFISKLYLITSMVIFGTIGIFRTYIPLPSGMLAMLRGLIGALFLIFTMLICRKKTNLKLLKGKLLLLIISGFFIGFNWILLFEAYNYTTVATATLCYYMAPVFVMLASPILLNEKINKKQIICSLFAICGMVLVSGIFEVGFSKISELIGVFMGLGAAIFYASIIIMNKKLYDVGSKERTIIQLAAAGIIILPYTIIFENYNPSLINIQVLFLILIVGLFHTGIAYALYFAAIKKVKAQTVAIYSYIDPILAIILSTCFLKQDISVFGWIGAVIVLVATFLSEKLK